MNDPEFANSTMLKRSKKVGEKAEDREEALIGMRGIENFSAR